MNFLYEREEMRIISILCLLLSTFLMRSKTLIITPAYNKPEFISLQYKCFKKFLLDDYEFIVFNDANDVNIEKQIEAECNKLAIRYFKVPQEIHKVDRSGVKIPWLETFASFRHGNVMQYALEQIGFNHNDLLVVIDSDMFITQEFSIREFMKEHEIGGLGAVRVLPYPFLCEHPWPQFCIFDFEKIKCKKGILLKAGFSGAIYMEPGNFLQYFIQSHPEYKVKLLKDIFYIRNYNNNEDLINKGFSPSQAKFIKKFSKIYNNQHEKTYDETYFVNNVFLHFTMAHSFDHYSNYSDNFKIKKYELFKNFLNKIS